MQLHPQISQVGGIITVTLIAKFVGDASDATDQQRIVAYGDPKVNVGGLFTDPNDNTFAFTFPASEKYVGITTGLSGTPVRFMSSLPQLATATTQGNVQWNPFAPGSAALTQQSDTDCVVSDPARAARIWAAALDTRVLSAMTILRAKSITALSSITDATI